MNELSCQMKNHLRHCLSQKIEYERELMYDYFDSLSYYIGVV